MLGWIAATLLILPAVMVDAQVVNVTIFTESQCPYCTKLLREQIWPFYVNRPGIMNLQLVTSRNSPPFINLIRSLEDSSLASAAVLSRSSNFVE
ncbi:hypothetical protein ANCDUO_26990 [Ancylostoma duodenale]|uniref:Glutaredoxin domain-containing protein n=1 Tax=Ancylostoma duodenale TaxID=51022 RepID=A0A0C2FD94_9BILA|nr:hypothetical protein ANCDUO_26990 [Ancylostoma duodenale]